MSLDFDDKGNLRPYEVISLTLSGLESRFVTDFESSLRRKMLFENLINYQLDLRNVLRASFKQWVNGSFVSSKANPKDIDLANLISYNDELDRKIEKLMPFFSLGDSDQTYLIDGHLIPVYDESDVRYENTLLRMAYFKKLFGYDREDNPKGFIELTVKI